MASAVERAMVKKRRRALEPSFVLVVASAAAAGVACAPEGGLAPGSTFLEGEDGKPPPTVSNNPPPPERRASPQFGPTVSLADAPPPLGAATLVVTADGKAVATDPDRDRVLVVALDAEVSTSIPLAKGDVPGRIALDDAGHAFVVLQRAGEIATIDTAKGVVTERRAVCPAPRGITTVDDALVVACAGGELVSLPQSGGAASILANLGPDLRDVVSNGSDRLLVSRLRTAELLLVDREGTVLAEKRTRPDSASAAAVAWRLVATHASSANGGSGAVNGALLVHQRARAATTTTVVNAFGSYASTEPCEGPIMSAVTAFDFEPTPYGSPSTVYAEAVLPVDVATAPAGDVALVAAGNGHVRELAQVQLGSWGRASSGGCIAQPTTIDVQQPHRAPNVDPDGQAVAVAFRPSGELLVLTREPALLHRVDPTLRTASPGLTALPWRTIDLGGESREDTGHAIFHANSGGSIACASCHPGGADDGRTWPLANGERRRTQSLQGTLANTAPYHWNGDAPSVAHIGETVFSTQMIGPPLATDQRNALESYLLRVPRVAPSIANSEAAARGKALFEGSAACATCHSGAALTNNGTVDVGTGRPIQVPSLVGAALHAPYFHDGRVPNLRASFGPLGGDLHGSAAALSEAEQTDLLAYLETL